jgi:hypothetical protein
VQSQTTDALTAAQIAPGAIIKPTIKIKPDFFMITLQG